MQAKPTLLGKIIVSQRKLHIKTNDEVYVLSGKDSGRTGVVLHVIPEKNRAIVERVNMMTQHVRRSAQSQGGRIEKEAPIHISNLKLICPRCNQPARTKRHQLENGFRVRVCRKCGEVAERE